jgi:hypothetical protein
MIPIANRLTKKSKRSKRLHKIEAKSFMRTIFTFKEQRNSHPIESLEEELKKNDDPLEDLRSLNSKNDESGQNQKYSQIAGICSNF